jgi:hypothetical protein
MQSCEPLKLSNLSSTAFSSSTLTRLCLHLNSIQDCVSLLDGRLKQLSTLIVTVYGTENHSTIGDNLVNIYFLLTNILLYLLG